MGGIRARTSAHISSRPREDKTKEREIVRTRGYVSRPIILPRFWIVGLFLYINFVYQAYKQKNSLDCVHLLNKDSVISLVTKNKDKQKFLAIQNCTFP